MLTHCTNSNIDAAYKVLSHLWRMGYSAVDLITNIFRVCKTMQIAEYLKLEYIKVSRPNLFTVLVYKILCFPKGTGHPDAIVR